jgi:hypothetical protein
MSWLNLSILMHHYLFLVVADNLMPFVAHILEDSYIAPDYLHLPRMLLTAHHTTQGTALYCSGLCCALLH